VPALVTVRNGPFRNVSKRTIHRWAERMLRCLGLADAELSIALTDDREIHELNRVFRHRDQATDVLAFAMREGEHAGASPVGDDHAFAEMLGDVVISVETARRQASLRGHDLEREVRELLAHGLLHLVGFDHQTKEEERAMNHQSRRLCRAALATVPAVRNRR
jgi:probable rRNA maturation factor